MTPPAPTTDQTQALARQIVGAIGHFADIPAMAVPFVEAIVVKALSGGDAQAIVGKVARIGDLGRQLLAELKD